MQFVGKNPVSCCAPLLLSWPLASVKMAEFDALQNLAEDYLKAGSSSGRKTGRLGTGKRPILLLRRSSPWRI